MSHLYFPGVPRAHQDYLFDGITKALPWASLIVVQAAVAVGKTWLAIAVSRMAAEQGLTSTITVPDGVLLSQLAREFPELAVPSKVEKHYCREHDKPCARVRATGAKLYCAGCPYTKANERVRTSLQRAMNYQSIIGLRKSVPPSDVLIVDEAHKVIDSLADSAAVKLWQHKYKWPSGLTDTHDLLRWIDTAKLTMPKDMATKLATVRSMILRAPDDVFMHIGLEPYRGKPEPVLTVRPLTVKDKTYLAIPKRTKTVVLMSATIGPRDVVELGFDKTHHGKTVYLDVGSPIPEDRRPIVPVPAVRMAHSVKQIGIIRMAELITETANAHADQAGLVHVTYEEMNAYRTLLKGPRWVFHTPQNRAEVFARWRAGAFGPAAVLVGAGLREGVDLVEDIARWQVITKLPRPSLADPFVAWKADKDPVWYAWQTAKQLLQMFGRVCRTPTDYGVTYIYDSSFASFYYQYEWMFPKHVKDSIKWP